MTTRPVDAPTGYVRGVNTVVCNETGGIFRTNIKLSTGETLEIGIDEGGHGLCVDLEDVMRPSEIEHCGINRLIAAGHVTIHPKGTTPRGRSAPRLHGGIAPVNDFDRKFDEVVRRDQAADARTQHVDRLRAEGR